jgi:hypothetical protein
VASNSTWQLDGLATRNDAARTVRVLLGRHYSCNRPVNAWCGYDAHIAGASLQVTIDWPYGTAPVKLTAQRLPAGTGAVAVPTTLRVVVVRPSRGRLVLTLPSVADGDAISVVAQRA